MIPAKVWEYRPADAALRRFVMLVLGLGVGFAAYGLYTWLLVQLPYDFHDQLAHGIMTARLRHGFYGPDGAPLIFAFLAYFGLLWLVPRWWRQAYLRRSTRLSIWSVVVTLFWAALINGISPFPQPWGLMFAATVSIAVQLASPWQTKRKPEGDQEGESWYIISASCSRSDRYSDSCCSPAPSSSSTARWRAAGRIG